MGAFMARSRERQGRVEHWPVETAFTRAVRINGPHGSDNDSKVAWGVQWPAASDSATHSQQPTPCQPAECKITPEEHHTHYSL